MILAFVSLLAHAAPVVADLDGDGVDESADVTIDAERRILLQVREGEQVTRLHVGDARDAMGDLDVVELSPVSAAEAGAPLLRLHVPGTEACGGSTVTSWISYAPGRLQLALRAVQWSDVPYWSHEVVVFDAASRVAVVTETTGEHLDEGTLEDVTRRRYELRDGVYVEISKDVVKKERPSE